MTDERSKLQTKVSPLIEGQVPDFIQADHPVFVRFLKEYYRFLEAGQIDNTATTGVGYTTTTTGTSSTTSVNTTTSYPTSSSY